METEPVEPQHRPRTSWWVALFSLGGLALAYYAAQFASGSIIYLYPLSQHWSNARIDHWLATSVPVQFVYVLLSEIMIILAIIGMMRLLHWTRRTIGLVRPQAKHLLVGAVAVVPYYLLYALIVLVVQKLVPSLNVNQAQQIGFDTAQTAFELALTFISLVILPPIVEEIAMRGFLYSGLRTWFPKVVSALLVSAVFGLAHLAGGGDTGPLWIGALDTFALSLVLVSLREMTGSLWAGMVLHALKNAIAFFLLFVFHSS